MNVRNREFCARGHIAWFSSKKARGGGKYKVKTSRIVDSARFSRGSGVPGSADSTGERRQSPSLQAHRVGNRGLGLGCENRFGEPIRTATEDDASRSERTRATGMPRVCRFAFRSERASA